MQEWNSIAHDRFSNKKAENLQFGFGILDISRDISSPMICKKTFDITYWAINQYTKDNGGYRGFSDTVDGLLEKSLNSNDDICIIQAQGTIAFKLPRLISLVNDYFKNNPDKFVIGHIMARKGRYPGLHRQILVVNLKIWKQLGKPPFLETGFFWDRKVSYVNYEVSENKIAAEYTPNWISPCISKDKKEYDLVEDGSNWVNIALDNDIIIDNLTLEMRECKCFLYPYEDTEQLEKAWTICNEEEIDKLKNYSAKAWFRKIYNEEVTQKDKVYVFNTDSKIIETNQTRKIDTLYSAAAGFNPLLILKINGFDKNTVIHYYDWSSPSLKFKKHLLESWDGLDLDKWLVKHDLEYNFNGVYRGNYKKFWELELEHVFGNQLEFKKLWDRYKSLEHHYHVIDIVNHPKELFDMINSETGNTVLWTTNIWESMQLHWNIEIEELTKKWNNFKSLIKSDLTVYGHELGNYPAYKSNNIYINLNPNT